jgi:hypothetical protein
LHSPDNEEHAFSQIKRIQGFAPAGMRIAIRVAATAGSLILLAPFV